MTNDQIMAFVAVKPDGTVDPVTSARNAIRAGASRDEAMIVFKAANVIGNPEALTGSSVEPPLPWQQAWEKIKAQPTQSPASAEDLAVGPDIVDFENIQMRPMYSPEWYAAEQPRDMPQDYIHSAPPPPPGAEFVTGPYTPEWYAEGEASRPMPLDYIHQVPYPEVKGSTRESSLAPSMAANVPGQTPAYPITPETGERVDFYLADQVKGRNPYSMQGSSMESRFAPGQPSEAGREPPVYGQTMETGERVDFTEPAQVHVTGPRGRGFSVADPTVISPSPEFYAGQSKAPPPSYAGQTPVSYDGQSMMPPPPDLSGQTPAPPMPIQTETKITPSPQFYAGQTLAMDKGTPHGPYGMTPVPPRGELHGPYGQTSANLTGQTMRPADDLIAQDADEALDKLMMEGQNLEAPHVLAKRRSQERNAEALKKLQGYEAWKAAKEDSARRAGTLTGAADWAGVGDGFGRSAPDNMTMAKMRAVKKALGGASTQAEMSARGGTPMRGKGVTEADLKRLDAQLASRKRVDGKDKMAVGGQTMKEIKEAGQKEKTKSYQDREAEYLKSIGMTAQEKQMYADADPKWRREGYRAVKVDRGDSPKEAGKKITDDVISQMAGVGGAEWEGFIPTIQNAIRQLENITQGRDPYDEARARVAGSSRRSLAGTEYAAKMQASQDVRSRTSKSMSKGANAALESGQRAAKLKDERAAKEESAATKLFDGMPLDSLLRWGKDSKNQARMKKDPRIGTAYMAAVKRARALETKSQAATDKKNKDDKDKAEKARKKKEAEDNAVTKFGESASKSKSTFVSDFNNAMKAIEKSAADGGRKFKTGPDEIKYQTKKSEWKKRFRDIQSEYDELYNRPVPKNAAKAEKVKTKALRALKTKGDNLLAEIEQERTRL